MSKKCLVLGGDGFLGSHLVEDLLKKGYRVKVFGRFQNRKTRNLPPNAGKIELVSGDFLDPPDLKKVLTNIDYVFHFISSTNPNSKINFYEEIRLNVLPTIKLLDICVRKKVKRIIFPSSGGSIYGSYPKGYASEEDPLKPISPHALGKLFVEQLLYYYFVQFQLDYVVYRISNAYGERQNIAKGQGVIPTIIIKALNGKTIKIYGNSIRDYIYVSDVTSFISDNFYKKHKYKIYNLGSGKGVSLFDLINVLGKQTGLTINIEKFQRRSFDVGRIILNTKRINEEFGFFPKTSLMEGIRKTYKGLKIRI